MVFSLLWDLYQEWNKPKVLNEVIFLHEKLLTQCTKHQFPALTQKPDDICSDVNCYFYNVGRIVSYLDKAEKTIDLCMYLISMTLFSDAIIRAHKRGVHVRVITDHLHAYHPGSKAIDFLNAGIPVRTRPSERIMHHKFCIIDRNEFSTAFILNGSLNWTKGSVCGGNMDNLVISSSRDILVPFCNEFNKLWNEFRIPVLSRPSPMVMHHKFCIIDGANDSYKSYLMSGSLNWTMSSTAGGNLENIYITSEPEIVLQYANQFQVLWDEFNEYRATHSYCNK